MNEFIWPERIAIDINYPRAGISISDAGSGEQIAGQVLKANISLGPREGFVELVGAADDPWQATVNLAEEDMGQFEDWDGLVATRRTYVLDEISATARGPLLQA